MLTKILSVKLLRPFVITLGSVFIIFYAMIAYVFDLEM
jgi:hypothetical protein